MEKKLQLVFVLFVLIIFFSYLTDFTGFVFLQGAGCSGMVNGTTFTDLFNNSDCVTNPVNVTVSNGSVTLAQSSGGGEITPDAGTLLLLHMNDNVSGAGQPIADNSGQNNNGTTSGNVNCTVTGKYGTGCSFDGSGDYITLSSTSLGNAASNFTIAAWVKNQATLPNSFSRGVVLRASNSYTLFLFDREPADVLRFSVWNSSSQGGSADAGSGFFDGSWHHVVGVYNGSNVLLYIDGQLQAIQPALTGVLSTNTRPVYIGTVDPAIADKSWNGVLDEVAIWNRALTASEIQTLSGAPITSGSFSSGQIPLGAAYNAVAPSWTGSTLTNVAVEISGDNSNWCVVTNNQQKTGSACGLATAVSTVYYRVTFTGQASLDSMQLSFANVVQPVCGNGAIEVGEQCEGTNINGQTCTTIPGGFTGGTLSCNAATCQFDTSQCTSPPVNNCGNGTINSGEQCDGSSLGGQDCISLGYSSGTLSCSANCTYNTANCSTPNPIICGNGTVEYGESCDDGDTTSNDGCSSACGIEYNYNCSGSPSNCSPINWTPPIGIPEPSFGIREQAGPATHIIDNTHPNCSDAANNPNGTPLRPRCTIPRNLPAGSVVEIHGGPYTSTSSVINIEGRGTQENPVFFRGSSAGSKPKISNKARINYGTYLIMENIDFDGQRLAQPGVMIAQTPPNDLSHHIAIRNSEIHDGNSVGISGPANYTPATVSNNIVVYNNRIHDLFQPSDPNGWQADYDQDYHGLNTGFVNYFWMIDNEVYHVTGDAIQANGGSLDAQGNGKVRYLYIGRNHNHDIKQTGAGIKSATDVVISQNWLHNFHPQGANPSTSGDATGSCCGDQKRVWFLFNHIYDSDGGIYTGESLNEDVYMIGNLIYNMHDSGHPHNAGRRGLGIGVRRGTPAYLINNTLVNVDLGLLSGSGGTNELYMANNIVSNVLGNADGTYHVNIIRDSVASVSQIQNSILYQPSGAPKLKWGTPTYNDLASFQTATGKCQGCVDSNPLFVNSAGNDFHLQANSPAVDSGVYAGTFVEQAYQRFFDLYDIDIRKDFDGDQRPTGAGWDMGALEFDGGTCTPSCDSNSDCSSGRYCQNPGLCNSICIIIPQQCTPVCDSNSDCLANQFCQNPGVCNAACEDVPVPQNCTDTDGDGISETPNCSAFLDQCPNTASGVLVNRSGCPMPIGYNLFTPTLTSDFNSSDLNRLDGLSLGIVNKAKIVFSQPVRLLNFNSSQNRHEPVNLTQTVDLNVNKVDVRSSLFGEFNKPARVTLFGLGFTNPVVKKDGVTCLNCLIENYSSGSLVFTVPGFSVYTASEGVCGDQWCQLNESCSTCQSDCGVCPPTSPGDDGSGPGGGSSDTGNPGHPLPNTRCTRIPVQPCPLAQWQEYPLCSWDVRQCTGELSEQCVAGQKRCSEAYLQECSQENEWVNSQECVNGCNVEALECNPLPLACTENWQCTDWSECQNGQQSRTCTDQNNCSTLQNQPVEIQACTVLLEQNPVFVLGALAAAIIITIIASILFIKQVIKKT